MVKEICLDPVKLAARGETRLFLASHNIFKDNNRIIDNKTHRQGKGKQGEKVEAEVGEIHDGKSPEKGKGKRRACNQ